MLDWNGIFQPSSSSISSHFFSHNKSVHMLCNTYFTQTHTYAFFLKIKLVFWELKRVGVGTLQPLPACLPQKWRHLHRTQEQRFWSTGFILKRIKIIMRHLELPYRNTTGNKKITLLLFFLRKCNVFLETRV